MFTTPSGDSAFDTEVTLGMNTFTGTGAQDTCVADDTETTCDISGSFAVGGAPIDWMGTHTFNNEASGPNNCSGASGTWTFDSINFGLLSGTFVSDASCLVEVTLFSENFDAFAGAGFAPTPAAGQLDSDIVIANGFSDGDVNYGDTAVTGDFARGESDGLGENTGGVYAFDVDGAGQIAMGVQPGGTDFTPGFFEYRIENTSGGALNNFTIAYDLWVNNDESRSNTFNFSYSIDGMSFTNVSSLDFASQAAANDDGFTITMQNGTFTASVADGAFIFFRFESADYGGSGFRDEFAVDNIVLTAN
jgi:hypothetical protein